MFKYGFLTWHHMYQYASRGYYIIFYFIFLIIGIKSVFTRKLILSDKNLIHPKNRMTPEFKNILFSFTRNIITCKHIYLFIYIINAILKSNSTELTEKTEKKCIGNKYLHKN